MLGNRLHVASGLLSSIMDGLILYSNTVEEYDSPEESVVVQILHEAGGHIGHDHLRESLIFEIRDKSNQTVFHLHHNKNINIKSPIYVMKNGSIVREHLPPLKHVEYYQDRDRNAAVGIVCDVNHNGIKHYELEGVITKDNDTYIIYPNLSKPYPQHRNGRFRHFIRRLNQSLVYTGDYTQPEKIPSPKPVVRTRLKRQGVTTYNVELLMVIDYSVYQYWYSRTSASTSTAHDLLAKDAIRQYYAYFLNGMDLRYKNIQENDMAFNILFAGIYIASTSGASPWTETIKSPNSENPNRPLVESDQALTDFKTWIDSQTGLPDFDHAMTFTSNDLTSSGSGNSNTGLAYVGAMCSSYALSICENYFNFQGLIVAAHELGHNLGSSHDGSTNVCDSDDHYIMSSIAGIAADQSALNPWYFSSCSVDSFRTLMNSLGAGNCLLAESPSYNPNSLNSYLGVQPGQLYDADTQCMYALGEATTVCRQAYDESTTYSDVCEGLFCYMPDSQTNCKRIYPGRGTSCGNQKWCVDGYCTPDVSAPAVPDNCPFGDHPGVLSSGYTCSQLVEQQPPQCYVFYKQCCGSCQAHHTNDPNCLYGDKDVSCWSMFRGDCYSNAGTCCRSCPDLYNANFPGCEYGDSWAGCEQSQCNYYTDATKAYCCETCCQDCAPFTGTPGYGARTTTEGTSSGHRLEHSYTILFILTCIFCSLTKP